MLDSTRGDRSALVALGLILAAIILVSAVGLLSRYLPYYPVPYADRGHTLASYLERGPAEGYWIPEVSARDTYAQWAMTGLALVATVISVLGVVLLRKTFEETKRTADAAVKSEETARQIGKAQTRAYLSCVGGSYTLVNQLCVLHLNIRNYGASPSPLAVISGTLIVPNMNSTGTDDQFLRTETKSVELFSIPAGGEAEVALALQISFPTKVRQELLDGQWYTSADFNMLWLDVFNEAQTVKFFLIETSKAFEQDPNLPLRRVGSLKSSNVGPTASFGKSAS